LVDWLVDWLVGWLIGWLIHQSFNEEGKNTAAHTTRARHLTRADVRVLHGKAAVEENQGDSRLGASRSIYDVAFTVITVDRTYHIRYKPPSLDHHLDARSLSGP